MAFTIFQDEDYLAVAKPPGVHFDDLSLTQGISGGPWEAVHRLDRETSGVLLFAREPLVKPTRALFQDPESSLEKIYLVGASRKPNASRQDVEGWVGARYRSSPKVRFAFEKTKLRGYRNVRPALHRVRPLPAPEAPTGHPFTGKLFEVELLTGARHQIRAYFEAVEAPLVGDPVYNPDAKKGERLELHAWKLRFEHPTRAGKLYSLEAKF